MAELEAQIQKLQAELLDATLAAAVASEKLIAESNKVVEREQSFSDDDSADGGEGSRPGSRRSSRALGTALRPPSGPTSRRTRSPCQEDSESSLPSINQRLSGSFRDITPGAAQRLCFQNEIISFWNTLIQ